MGEQPLGDVDVREQPLGDVVVSCLLNVPAACRVFLRDRSATTTHTSLIQQHSISSTPLAWPRQIMHVNHML